MILVVLVVTYLSPEPSLKTVSLAIYSSTSISSQEVFVTAIPVEEGLCFGNSFSVYICTQVFGELDDLVVLFGTK